MLEGASHTGSGYTVDCARLGQRGSVLGMCENEQGSGQAWSNCGKSAGFTSCSSSREHAVGAAAAVMGSQRPPGSRHRQGRQARGKRSLVLTCFPLPAPCSATAAPTPTPLRRYTSNTPASCAATGLAGPPPALPRGPAPPSTLRAWASRPHAPTRGWRSHGSTTMPCARRCTPGHTTPLTLCGSCAPTRSCTRARSGP